MRLAASTCPASTIAHHMRTSAEAAVVIGVQAAAEEVATVVGVVVVMVMVVAVAAADGIPTLSLSLCRRRSRCDATNLHSSARWQSRQRIRHRRARLVGS